MKIRNFVLFTFSVFLSCSCTDRKHDICVYGETASGVVAAIQGARMGKDVVLVSKNTHVGGMATSGLTATDINRHKTIGGIAAEFYGRIYEYYSDPAVWRNQTREEFMESTKKRTYTGKNDSRRIQWVYESGVAEKIMKEMLEEAGVKVLYETRLAEEGGVKTDDGRIISLRFENGTELRAKQFIDASYEGDLMAAAGVSYIVGREANSTYGETLNGIRINYEPSRDLSFISPYTEDGELLPYVDAAPWGEQGEADGRTQAYCYRVTLTDDPSNMVPIEKPEDYNPLLYEIMLQETLAKPDRELKDIITFTPMPNRKTDTNHLDFFGASFDYPEADYAWRAQIEAEHRSYAIGMLWFLGHDPRVPESMRTEMLRWGFPKDEFTDNGNFPYQIYVREARRMIGDFVMTERNVVKENRTDAGEPVGLGSYALDCHYVSRVVDRDGKLKNEGTIFRPVAPYPVSYRALVPKREECTNLLVPVCLSASHVAYSSIRMEPNYMVLGQSAGTAAAMAADSGCAVQDVNYEELRERLVADGQILEY